MRVSLDECLASILAQDLPKNLVMNVIVADNAPKTYAQVCVLKHAQNTQTRVRYVHAPSGNISIARNACLQNAGGDYVAFIDDDEIAPADWLANLWHVLADNDVIFGPVVACYPPDAPNWIVGNDFHSTTLLPTTGMMKTGYAGNVLMRWRHTLWEQERFDLALGTTGGEDTDFFNRLHHLGADLAFSPLAFVTEPVTGDRINLRWLAKRRFRSGQSFADIAMLDVHRAVLFSTAFLKSSYSAICLCLNILSAKRAGFWVMRCIFHLGVVTRSIRPTRAPESKDTR